jgi:Protein of unknown function (DUF3014)
MEAPKSALRRPSRGPWFLLAAVLIGGAIVAFLSLRRLGGPRRPPEATPAAAAPDASAAPEAKPAGPAPSAEPAQVQSLLEAVSPNTLFRRGLAAGDVVRRWAAVTADLAEGESPREQLELLAPGRPFAAVSRGDRRFIAPASYQRYDGFAAAVASIDAQAAARVYRELHRVLEGAYQALGYPGASLDGATARALRRIEAAPVRDADVEVVEDGGLFLFADPRLEELGEVEKHLLRMGPRNTRLVQEKARELLRILDLPAGGGSATPRTP